MLDPNGTAGYLYDEPDSDDTCCTICDGPCHCDTDYDKMKDEEQWPSHH